MSRFFSNPKPLYKALIILETLRCELALRPLVEINHVWGATAVTQARFEGYCLE